MFNKSFLYSIFAVALFFVFVSLNYTTEYLPSYKIKNGMNPENKIEGRAEEREMQLKNVITGKIEEKDWYNALRHILNLKGKLTTRTEDLTWEQLGPDQVGGRTRCFIFDNQNSNKCYTAGVSGGIYESSNLGESWSPVENMSDSIKIMSIGCMSQSINGDIYAGTGEYWGNTPQGSFSSQFYGNGIYKKSVGENEWKLLPSTIFNYLLNATNNGNFQQVIDISTDPLNNEIVYAGTTKGLFRTTDGGIVWTKLNTPAGVVAQIKIAINGDLYAAIGASVFKSKDKGIVWTNITTNPAYQAEGKQHIRIALSSTNAEKLYVAGINSNGDLKYVIQTENGGNSWRFLGKGDAFLNPLCSQIGANRVCQGWYDLCLATHPKDDNILFLGGSLSMYSWSLNNGWVQMTFWNFPAVLGNNEVHADMHEFAFHKNSDTMVILNDGGVYMTTHSFKNYPNKVEWKPKNNFYNVCQFYDMDANIYGELIGGAQDNGTQFATLRGSTSGLTNEVSGGDGFDCAISGMNDYKVAFATIYDGALKRTSNLSAIMNNIVAGSCASNDQGNLSDVGFHTRIYLAEDIESIDIGEDKVNASFLFAFNTLGGFYLSNNATDVSQSTKWTSSISVGIGQIICGHHSNNLSEIYLGGVSGVRKLSKIKEISFDTTIFSGRPCLVPKKLDFTTMTGVSGPIGGIYVDQNDQNHVVATQIGFGGTTKVFESTNGLSFSSKQGNLPIMPVYTCVIDPEDSKHVVLGTEFGIWETSDISVPKPIWKEQNIKIGRVPVFKLRLRKLRKNGCNVLYAGTHGRGFFRVPFPDNSDKGCDYKLRPRDNFTTSGTSSIINIDLKFEIYPNPASSLIHVTFHSKLQKKYFISIYSMTGILVKQVPYNCQTGDNIINIDINSLSKGSYIIRLEDKYSVIEGKKVVFL